MDFHKQRTFLHKHIKSLLACVAAIAACATIVVACGGNHATPYIIGISQCSIDDWRDKLNSEYRMMSYIDDSIEVVIKSARDDSRTQIRQIDSLIAMGVDLLIISPNQLKELTPVIEKAYGMGIPVILYDRKIDSEKYTAFIGSNNYQIGCGLGQYVGNQLGGRGRIAEVLGLEGSSPAIERHRGFADAIKQFPGVKIVDQENANWEQRGGEVAMDRILSRTTDVDYVFVHNDRMAYGAYLALKRHGMDGKIKILGVDGLTGPNGGVDLVCRGILDASYLNPTNGDEVILLAKDILQGKPYRKQNDLSVSIITKDNAELTKMASESFEHQMAVLEELHSQVDRYANYNRNQNSLLLALASVCVLIVVALVFLFRAFLSKNRMSKQLIKKTDDLEMLNKEVVELTQSRIDFFTNVSHELRTPLTLILDPVETLLSDMSVKQKNRQMLDIIKRNALYLLYLVNDLMDFRKIQNGKMKLHLSRFDLLAKLREWTGDFFPMAEQKKVSLSVDTAKFSRKSVTADEEKVCRIVYNLISNAIKYTEAGGSISVTLEETTEDRLMLKVKDTGVGISDEDQLKVFNRFFQASGAVGGTGIGLAVVKAYAELHGGTVEVESLLGQGTTMTVVMPCEQDMSANAQSDTDAAEAHQRIPSMPSAEAYSSAVESIVTVDESKRTVLVVDDNADIREYMGALLRDQYNVLEASDGRTALDIARRDIPDIVLCDVMMPVMDGLELCRELRKDATISHIPVILITAKNLDEQKIEGYEQGADAYITKPFNSKLLLTRIENLLNNRKMLKGLFRGSMPEDVDDRQLGSSDKRFISSLRSIIQKNMGDADFGVEEIGQEMGLSRVQLYRKVKALTGLSAVDLLRKARLQKAKVLLEKSNKSVSEIAYEVGFSSPSYFAKCFKDEYDTPPGEFRK